MSWKSNLRPASFRGVKFYVDDREYETGRRVHNHEYPKRDENFVEDMGRASRRWQVKAYLVGDDYMARRDQLIEACEQQGPASYVDRWGRSHQVVCEHMQVREAEKEGRYCTVSLKMIAAGSAPSAMGIPAAVAQVIGAADDASGSALAAFARTYLPGQLLDAGRVARLPDGVAVPAGAIVERLGIGGVTQRLTGILN